jgi:hypothetical protein
MNRSQLRAFAHYKNRINFLDMTIDRVIIQVANPNAIGVPTERDPVTGKQVATLADGGTVQARVNTDSSLVGVLPSLTIGASGGYADDRPS